LLGNLIWIPAISEHGFHCYNIAYIYNAQVIPAEEHAAKIAAARAAIGDADFFLIARTDARAATGLDDAIARANLYMEVRSQHMSHASSFVRRI
jgi:isocitrate lyase